MRGCVAKLTAELCRDASVERTDVLEVTFVGNPVMHHLLLGSTRPTRRSAVRARLGRRASAPRIASSVSRSTRGARLRAAVHRRSRRRRHRGRDPRRGAVSLGRGQPRRRRRDERRDRPREPGAAPGRVEPDRAGVRGRADQLRPACRAGAIERVRIDTETLEPRVKVVGCDAWSDEPGLADAGHRRLRLGDRRGRRRVLPRGGADDGRHVDGSLAARTRASCGRSDVSTSSGTRAGAPDHQNDSGRSSSRRRPSTRDAGCRIDRSGLERVDRVRLAGAFGAHIDPVYALASGWCRTATRRVTSAGNAAGTGARIALRDRAARDRDPAVLRTSREDRDGDRARFQDTSSTRWRSRTQTDPYERLGAVVALPPRRAAPAGERTGRRRRRRISERRAWMSETRSRRSGGRAARQAARLHAPRRAGAVPDPHHGAGRDAVGGGARRRSRRTPSGSSAGGGDRVPRRAGRARASARELGRTSRESVPRSPAGLVPHAGAGDRASAVHAGRAGTARTTPSSEDRETIFFAPAYGSPFVRDLDGGRRYGDDRGLPQLREARVRVARLHHLGPHGVPAARRAGQQAALRHGLRAYPGLGQAVHGPLPLDPSGRRTRSRWRASSSAGDFVDEHAVVFSLINANSPLVWDATMLGAARAYAEANQAVMMTPFILAGAMSPSTVAADLRADARPVARGDGRPSSSSALGAPVVLGALFGVPRCRRSPARRSCQHSHCDPGNRLAPGAGGPGDHSAVHPSDPPCGPGAPSDLPRSSRQQSILSSHMQETLSISGAVLVKSFAAEKAEAEKFRQNSINLMRTQIRSSPGGPLVLYVPRACSRPLGPR